MKADDNGSLIHISILCCLFHIPILGCTSESRTSGSPTAGAGGDGAVPSATGGTGSGASSQADASAGAQGDASVTPSGDSGAPTQMVSSIFRICGLSSASGTACDGLDAYITCVQSQCDTSLAQCFGQGYPSDDFTGGTCADYATCATSAADPCSATCSPSADCQTCLGDLVICIQSSPCKLPLCEGTLPDGGTTGGGLPDGGTGISGTCSDLQACCASITDSNYRDACNQALSDAQSAGGEADCAVVYSTYRAAGICG